MKKTIYLSSLLLFIFIPLFMIISCDNENQHSDEADVTLGGVSHKNGLTDPANNCNFCHGEILTGAKSVGKVAPSCYSCHGPLWEEITDEEATFIEGND